MQQVRLTLPMIPNMELTASKTACAMGEQIGLSPDKIDEVQMAVVEACINAFEHSGSSEREVHVLLQVLGADDEPRGLEMRESASPLISFRDGRSKKDPRVRVRGVMV